MTHLPHVTVLLLNWKAAPETIRCLESVFKLDYTAFSVVVCDNASPDDSLQRLRDWADGKTCVQALAPGLEHLVEPPHSKPISYRFYQRESALSGGEPDDPRLVFIQVGSNRGYAAGNNVGLQYCLARKQARYIWLLNTDTVVHPQALSELVRRAEADDRIGMVGSTLLQLENPDKVQTFGGAHYRRFKGDGAQIGSGSTIDTLPDAAVIEQSLDFIIGASMLVKRRFVEQVGFISEDYFLYCEEMDWALRAKGRFSLAFAPKSWVYHQQGGSTPSFVGAYFFYRNTLRFAARYFPAYWIFQYLHLLKRWLKAVSKRDKVKRRALSLALTGRVPPEFEALVIKKPPRI